jgi:hypothetical protein
MKLSFYPTCCSEYWEYRRLYPETKSAQRQTGARIHL